MQKGKIPEYNETLPPTIKDSICTRKKFMDVSLNA